jgi:hypothetical protein
VKLEAMVNPSVYQQQTVYIRLPDQDDNDEPHPLFAEEESTPESIGWVTSPGELYVIHPRIRYYFE